MDPRSQLWPGQGMSHELLAWWADALSIWPRRPASCSVNKTTLYCVWSSTFCKQYFSLFYACRVSADKLRRLSLAMADIENEIRKSKNSVDLEDIIKCADLLAKNKHYTGNIPDILIYDEPPAYDECIASNGERLLSSKEQVRVHSPWAIAFVSIFFLNLCLPSLNANSSIKNRNSYLLPTLHSQLLRVKEA